MTKMFSDLLVEKQNWHVYQMPIYFMLYIYILNIGGINHFKTLSTQT